MLRLGYFGSYARGDWGVGSDVDLVIIVQSSALPSDRRPCEWDATGLPVPADIVVYTADEWRLLDRRRRFPAMLDRETVWVYTR